MSALSRLRASGPQRDRPPGPAIPRYRIALWVFVLAIALLYALWYGNSREDLVLNAQTRQELGGTYIELKDGVTHFDVSGPYDGPLFVLVHGGTMGMFVWDEQVEALTGAGFQVLRYDSFGRGFSDRPDAEYTLDFAVAQLEEMIDRFSGGNPVHLAGVSMGGLVAAAYAARHPERVARMSLISPVIRGVRPTRGLPGFMARIPGVGELAMRVYGMNRLESRARTMLHQLPGGGGRIADRFTEQLRYRGFERAMLSTLRGDLLRDQRAVYEALGRTDVPVLVLWGADDREIPPADMELLRQAVPQVQFQTIPGAGHGLLVQAGQQVREHMTAFHRSRQRPDRTQ